MKLLCVGGPQMKWGRWYACKPGDTTFTIDIPRPIPGWSAFKDGGTGMRMVRYGFNIRYIEGWDIAIADYDWANPRNAR